jgi:DNA primase
MDVIALVRAGFEHAVAPLGTAFTEDQLQLLWRTAPEPILCFDGDGAGLRAGIRAAHLALPHLKPGFSLRFAFLPEGEDPDTLIKREGAGAMKKILDEAQPLSKVLWRSETEDKDFSTPERRAGLERALSELVGRISDSKIADYYRRDFEQQVFENFKRRAPSTPRYYPARNFDRKAREFPPQRGPSGEMVSSAVKSSSVARSAQGAVRETEIQLFYRLVRNPEFLDEFLERVAAVEPRTSDLERAFRALLDIHAKGRARTMEEIMDQLLSIGYSSLVKKISTDKSLAYIVPKDANPESVKEALQYAFQQQFELQTANENNSNQKSFVERQGWKGPTFEEK